MKKLLKDKRVIVIVIAIILVFLLLDFNQRMVLLTKLRGQEKELQQQFEHLEATRNSLKTEIAYANSDDAVERWAREEAGMIQDGDVPIVLLPPSNPIPTATPDQRSTVDEVKKWEIWQELFFGN